MKKAILYASIMVGITLNLAVAEDFESTTKCLYIIHNKTYDNKKSYTITGIPKHSEEGNQTLQSGKTNNLKEAKEKLRALAAQHDTRICTSAEIIERERHIK